MRVARTVFADPTVLGRVLAERIADEIEAARSRRRHYVLGCPGGRTPMSTYTELVRVVARRGLDLSHVVVAMMDEYLTTDPGTGALRPVDDGLPHSCRRFGREVVVGQLSSATGRGKGIAEDGFWVPDPVTTDTYDRRIADIGGVDLFLLACGASDGHVGFNPPGSPVGSRTRVVRLAQSTRRDNLVTFPTLRTLDRAPEYGVTVGIDTILRHSRSAVMVVHGADKSEVAARIQAAESYDPRWPATLVTECQGAALFVDRAAAARGRPPDWSTDGPDQARLPRWGIDPRSRDDGVVPPPQ